MADRASTPSFVTGRSPWDKAQRLLWRVDPGLLQTGKALAALVGLGLAVLAGFLLAGLSPDADETRMRLFAGAGAITLALTAMAPDTRERQIGTMVVCAVVFQAIYLAFGGLLWLLPQASELVAKLALIPLAVICLYLWRFGGAGAGLGKAVFSLAVFVQATDPAAEEIVWAMLASALGSALFILCLHGLPRPTARRVIPQAKRLYLQEVAARIRVLAGSDHGHNLGLRHSWLGRQPLRSLLRRDRTEVTTRFEDCTRDLRTSYRIELASRLLDKALDTSEGLSDALWSKTTTALLAVAGRFDASGPGTRAAEAAIEDLRSAALDLPAEEADSRRHLVGACAAMHRLLLLHDVLLGGRLAPTAARPPVPLEAQDRSVPFRLSLQGLVAVLLTTAVDLGFAMAYGYWATVTAFLILSGSLGETVMRGQKRVIGTAFGVLLALLYVWAFGNAGNLVLGLLTTLALGLVITAMPRFYAVGSLGVGFMVIGALHLVQGLTLDDMLARIYETAIGALVGIFVARLVLPIRLAHRLHRDLDLWLQNAQDLLMHLGHRSREQLRLDSQALAERAGQLGDVLPHLRAEAWFGVGVLARPVAVHTALETIIGYLALLEPSVARMPFEAGGADSDKEARQQRARVASSLAALRKGDVAEVHHALAIFEQELKAGEHSHFVGDERTHLNTRLEQIFYLSGLLQIVDDLASALYPDRTSASDEAITPQPVSPAPPRR